MLVISAQSKTINRLHGIQVTQQYQAYIVQKGFHLTRQSAETQALISAPHQSVSQRNKHDSFTDQAVWVCVQLVSVLKIYLDISSKKIQQWLMVTMTNIFLVN